MTRNSRSWLFFTVSTAALAVSSVLVGMTNHKGSTPKPAPLLNKALAPLPDDNVMAYELPRAKAAAGFTSVEIQAKNVLTMELNRRFTDRQNVDFGMSRVIRDGTRLHRGPIMARAGLGFSSKTKTRRTSDGRGEFEFDGKWYPNDQYKPLMTAENENESRAMATLRDAMVDVAIYTIGQFELDKGEKPEPQKGYTNPNPNYDQFNYGKGDSLRLKGPAYTHQDSAMAPRTYELVNFGRRAWASNQVDFIAEGEDGWVYFAHRVNSTDATCAGCHGDRKGYEAGGKTVDIKGAIQKPGDPVGLFVVALRRADAK